MQNNGIVKTKQRDKYPTKTIRLVGKAQLAHAMQVLDNAPIDVNKPLEVVIREEVKQRKPDQNALMWVRELKDISEQAYVDGRTYTDTVWHEHFKELYLPENEDPELIRLVKDPQKYRKWDYTPNGKKVLIGSTTELTIRGFALYLSKVELMGESLGVRFHVRSNN